MGVVGGVCFWGCCNFLGFVGWCDVFEVMVFELWCCDWDGIWGCEFELICLLFGVWMLDDLLFDDFLFLLVLWELEKVVFFFLNRGIILIGIK